MKARFSDYLTGIKAGLQEMIALLRREYDYVSVLATDSTGLNVRISQRSRSVSGETMTTERGVVVRVCTGGQYAEYAFNSFDPASPEKAAAEIKGALEAQLVMLRLAGVKPYNTPLLPDEAQTLFVEKETQQLPETADVKALVDRLGKISDRGMELNENAIECIVSAQSTHICKMFLTEKRDLCQSYVYSEGAVFMVVSREGNTQTAYESLSGLCGPELFDGFDEKVEKAAATAATLLDAQRIEPGEYEIIASPEVTGLIAHEAFGHGVERWICSSRTAPSARITSASGSAATNAPCTKARSAPRT